MLTNLPTNDRGTQLEWDNGRQGKAQNQLRREKCSTADGLEVYGALSNNRHLVTLATTNINPTQTPDQINSNFTLKAQQEEGVLIATPQYPLS